MITLPENASVVELKWSSYGRGWEAKAMARVAGAMAYGAVTDGATAEAAYAAAVEKLEADRARILARLDYAAAEFAPHFAEAAHA